jgi:hypothetical protein
MLELRSELLANLSQRFLARTIKLVLGPQVPSCLSTSCRKNSALKCPRDWLLGQFQIPATMSAALHGQE